MPYGAYILFPLEEKVSEAKWEFTRFWYWDHPTSEERLNGTRCGAQDLCYREISQWVVWRWDTMGLYWLALEPWSIPSQNLWRLRHSSSQWEARQCSACDHWAIGEPVQHELLVLNFIEVLMKTKRKQLRCWKCIESGNPVADTLLQIVYCRRNFTSSATFSRFQCGWKGIRPSPEINGSHLWLSLWSYTECTWSRCQGRKSIYKTGCLV